MQGISQFWGAVHKKLGKLQEFWFSLPFLTPGFIGTPGWYGGWLAFIFLFLTCLLAYYSAELFRVVGVRGQPALQPIRFKWSG